LSIYKVVYESDLLGDGDFRWDSSQCTDFENQESNNFCDDCKSSCLAAVSMVVTNLITSLPGVRGSLTRRIREDDRNCDKVQGIIMGVTGTISTLLALSIYADVCARELPDHILSQSVDYELGPGFICLLVATLLMPIDVFINLLTPVPQRDEASSYQDGKEPASGSVDSSPHISLRKTLLD